MDTLTNLKSFLTVVRTGSFSAASRSLNTVPSVITKRINQLEHQLKVTLFNRSTRKLELTEAGERYYPRLLSIVTEMDNALQDLATARSPLQERLRIKCPTTLTIQYFGDILTSFQKTHPGVSMELVLMDRSVNPIEEGFDIAIGALPSSYADVMDIPLCPMPRILIAAPDYLAHSEAPQHPRDLIEHDCLTFLATGTSWFFDGPSGTINVDVKPRVSVNDSLVLMNAVENGLGIAMVAKHIALPSVQSGKVVPVLEEFPVPDLWVKALVPQNRRSNPAVQEAINWLKQATQPTSPWDRSSPQAAAANQRSGH